MKYKKFFLIPLLIFVYVFFVVDMLVNFNPAAYSQPAAESGGGQQIGVGEAVSVVVTRSYLFGLVRLPVYTNYVGYIGDYHQAFFYFVGILAVAFLVIEWRARKSARGVVAGKIGWRGNKTAWGDGVMKNLEAKRLLKALGIGLLFGFVTYILSGESGASVGLFLLMAYLEYKLK